jgi:hypothetical protein
MKSPVIAMSSERHWQPLSIEQREMLLAAVGAPESELVWTEEAFLQDTGCPADELEVWLRDSWMEHDIAAVLAKKQEIGPQPVLLVRTAEDQLLARLLCPSENLLRESYWELFLDGLNVETRRIVAEALASQEDSDQRLLAHAWWEWVDGVAASINHLTEHCRSRALPIAEIKMLWLALQNLLKSIFNLRTKWLSDASQTPCPKALTDEDLHKAQLRRLLAAMQAFEQAFRQRGQNSSQASYAEARLSCRRALQHPESPSPFLTEFPVLQQMVQEACWQDGLAYLHQEIHPRKEHHLDDPTAEPEFDLMSVIAEDLKDPEQIPNPPARVRTILSRARRRQDRLDCKRGQELPPEDALAALDSEDLESSIIVGIDLERAQQNVPGDSARVIEARFDGLDLQSPTTPEYLGMEPRRLQSIRRSLEPDRTYGKKLRRYLAAYRPKPTETEGK